MDLTTYHSQAALELQAILDYWMRYATDENFGGFFGRVDQFNRPEPSAPKGLVLNSRILWTFSAAYNLVQNPLYLSMAERAYRYLLDHFEDPDHGGMYWSVDFRGDLLNGRKQLYGQAFALYGFSEFFRATGRQDVLQKAIGLFTLIEGHGFDPACLGYFEAFDRQWGPEVDLRLSQKDANEKKTMNTHLHVLEAYTCLYRLWPDSQLRGQILNLLDNFHSHMIDGVTSHLGLYFDEAWNLKAGIISYGHDIEAAWLLLEAARATGDSRWIATMREHAVKMARAAAEGLDGDGGLWYEYDQRTGHLSREKHWWPQAEAMVGFLNAYEVSGDLVFLQQSYQAWQFTMRHIKDPVQGEWFWGVDDSHRPMEGQDKAGFWKCPYHNSRACMEIIGRTAAINPTPHA